MGTKYDLESAEKNEGRKIPPLFPSARGYLSLIGFFATIILYLLRINMSIAVICMTIENETEPVTNGSLYGISGLHDMSDNPWSSSGMWVYDSKSWDQRAQSQSSNPESVASDTCPGEAEDDEEFEETGDFYWGRELRGTLNSSFFWGYVLTQFIGGIMAVKLGAKWVLGGGMILSIVCTLLSPAAAKISPYALMAARFVNGLGSGVFFPCFHHLWALWAPPKELSRLYAFETAGISWGSLLSFALSGVLCQQLGWEWIFYMYGLWGVVFMIFWSFMAYDSPSKHPRISQEERLYIENSLGNNEAKNEPLSQMPWFKIFFMPECLALWLINFTGAWGGYTNLTSLPQYMEDILKFNIATNGLVNALPHFMKWVFTLLFAWIADYLIGNDILSVKHTRQFFQTLGSVPPAILSIIVAYLDCFSTGWVVFCLIFAEAFTAGSRVGYACSVLDMMPRYSGIVMGIANTFANMSGIFAPIVVANLTTDGTQEQWRQVFYLSAMLYMVGWFFYMITVKGDVLPWALGNTKLETSMIVDESTTVKDEKPNGHVEQHCMPSTEKYRSVKHDVTYDNKAYSTE